MTLLDREDAEQHGVDEERRVDRSRHAGIDRFGHDEVADEADRVPETEKMQRGD